MILENGTIDDSNTLRLNNSPAIKEFELCVKNKELGGINYHHIKGIITNIFLQNYKLALFKRTGTEINT